MFCLAFIGLIALTAMQRAAAADDASKADLAKLQGKWKIDSLIANGKSKVVNGKDVDSAMPGENVWTISDNKVKYSETEDEIKLDASQKPKAMDIQVVRDDAPEKLLAIYEIEADTLKICVAFDNKGRPKKFESKAGSGHRFFILKRIKE